MNFLCSAQTSRTPRLRHFAEALGEEAGRELARSRTSHEWIELALSALGLVPGCRAFAELAQLGAALLARDFKALGLGLLQILPLELLPGGKAMMRAFQLLRQAHKMKRTLCFGARLSQRAALLAA